MQYEKSVRLGHTPFLSEEKEKEGVTITRFCPLRKGRRREEEGRRSSVVCSGDKEGKKRICGRVIP